MEPSSRMTDIQHKEFLKSLARDYGVLKKQPWVNNNSTLAQKAYVIDVKDLERDPANIISRIYKYNISSGRDPVLCIPVAGWDPEKDVEVIKSGETFAEKQMLKEYAVSYSLSNFTTTGSKPVDFILRVSKAAQKIKVFEKDGKYYARITAGVRIRDADDELFKAGFAFFPNNTTLDPASVVGIHSNGAYGPDGKEGPISTKVVEIRGVDVFGNSITLSDTQNAGWFRVVRDCHMGTCFFESDITIEIEKKYPMKQHHVVYKDVAEFKDALKIANPIEQDHFIAMYFPVENGLRVTTFSRTDEKPEHVLTQQEKDNKDFVNLLVTEASEPLIDLITRSETLRSAFPLVLKSAALKTYGFEKETTHIDWSAHAMHIFGTYTDLPIYDINWLIQVDSRADAAQLAADFLTLAERILKEEGEKKQYPILNGFVRYTKGVADPTGEKGVAPTMVDDEEKGILACEFVTYTTLSKTESFKKLVNAWIEQLNGRKYTYHYPKHMPKEITSLTQLMTDDLGKKRLKNFQDVVAEMHGGEDNLQYSPFLTPEKRKFIGIKGPSKRLTKAQKERALNALLKLAEEHGDGTATKKLNKKLTSLK